MASSSPRIDQFFASKKKRKNLSPAIKAGKIVKDAKASIEGSPSAKGSLKSYLVTSQDDGKPSFPAGEPAGPLHIKKNLTLEIGSSAKDVSEEALLSGERHNESLCEAQRAAPGCCSDVAAQVVESVGEDKLKPAQPVETLELKQFASSFLSFYCSEVLPTGPCQWEGNEKANKRHGDPALVDFESKPSKRRDCHVDGKQCDVEDDLICSPDIHAKRVKSSFVNESGPDVLKSSREVSSENDASEPQRSFRKCSTTSTNKMVVSNTPCTSKIKLEARETPKSTRGSSMFSPGEAFWNEAIQVADGLFAPSDNFPDQVASKITTLGTCNEIHVLNNVKYEECNGKPNKVSDGGSVRGSHEISSVVASSISKRGKGSDKEVSPLPIKHFDFSFEDQKLDAENQSHTKNSKSRLLRCQKSACASLDHQGLSSSNTVRLCIKEKNNTDLFNVQGGNSRFPVSQGRTDFLIQDRDGVMSVSPDVKLSSFDPIHDPKAENTPSSIALLKDRLDLSNWLPSEICNIYKKKGISKLYPWQVDCLQVDGVLQNRNLVYCASTSAGKSFVAEILMLRRVLSTGKMAFLVLPYVSICAEKTEHLEALLEPLDKHVRSYYGNQGGGNLPKDTAVAVCTIEKANSLINRLLEEGRLSELGIIVIDELHMVGDQNRGYLLELMLTKLRYAAGEGNTESSSGESSGMSSGKSEPARGLQIVGMSATLPNVAAVADWLQAALYQTDFRPVPLEEYIKVGNTIYDKEMNIIRTIPKVADVGGRDPDQIVELCNEVVQEGNSVLIFCSSRKGCESTARHVAKYLKKFSGSTQIDQNEPRGISFALDELRRSPSGLDPILEEILPAGVAYHHAGLTVEERETVEACYRKGLVRVLTATSTLAAGVNLPARRVIFRQPRIGRDFIDGTRYRQMAGRAGRTGIDTKGESVLICKPEEVKRIMGLLNDSCPPLHSCLSEDKNGMTHAILEVVAGGIVQTATDIHRYVRCTLLNATKPFEDVVKSAQDALRWLCHKKFLDWSEETKLYTTTPLGRASFGSSLCPEESLIVLDDLLRAREGFVLASDLHLVYLVTPINVDVQPDWELYYGIFMELSIIDQSVGNRVGVHEPFLMRISHGAPVRFSSRSRDNTKGLQGKFDNRYAASNQNMLSDEQTLRVCKRFYVALILSRLVQEVPVGEVCEAYRVARGLVQALQENAGRFASMVSVFCERLGWNDLEGLVAKFQNRVSFGVRAEIVELTTIPYVKGSRARALYKAGLRTPQAIAEASIPDIAKALFESSSWAAQGTAQQKLQLGVAKKIKNEARKIVLERAEEARIAAFSAFRSLGLDIPSDTQPVLPTIVKNATRKELTTSSGEDSVSSIAALGHSKDVQMVSYLKDVEETDKLISKIEVGKSINNSAFDLETSIGAYSPGNLHGGLDMGEPALIVEGSAIPKNDSNGNVHCVNDTTASPSLQLRIIDNSNNASRSLQLMSDVNEANNERPMNTRDPQCAIIADKGPQCAIKIPGGLDSFLDMWDSAGDFFFDVHFSKRSEVNSTTLFEILGIAVCWEISPVYYINLPKDLLWSAGRRNEELLSEEEQLEMVKRQWSRLQMIMGKKDVKKFTWNLKVQIQVLKCPSVSVQRFGSLNIVVKSMGLEIDNSCHLLSPVHVQDAVDLCIVAWILWPDEERSSNPNLEKEVKKRLSSEAAAAASRSGRWKNQMRRVAHNGCCRRVAQTRALYSVLWKLLISEKLIDALLNIEIPLVKVLADMELWGIGVDMEKCLEARQILGRKLKNLEKEAFKLAGMTFSLYTAADIANVLYTHLKLPTPEGHNKGKQHPSTDKRCLDLLRDEHPIIPIIREHRTLAKLLNSTLGSICSLSRLSMRLQKYTLHGHWLQTSTATGRLSVEEPNLQCVEHTIDFQLNKCNEDKAVTDVHHFKVNARDFFIPTQDNWLLLTADYSQIELRLMAHFSKDTALIEFLNRPHSDVFTMIAAKWTGKLESSVSMEERDHTKRLVYGILYGMGANTLAEQLECSSDEAADRIKSFKRSFPGVASWLHEAVASCRQKGYVETLKGRKRFLAKIKFGNSKEKSKAERQAVNSICQGSAADIIKIAMINIYSLIIDEGEKSPDSESTKKFEMLRGRCRILLQVHDELVLEADPSVAREAGLLLKTSMENAVSLLVPLHVKLKVGRTWGSLEPFLAEERQCYNDEFL